MRFETKVRLFRFCKFSEVDPFWRSVTRTIRWVINRISFRKSESAFRETEVGDQGRRWPSRYLALNCPKRDSNHRFFCTDHLPCVPGSLFACRLLGDCRPLAGRLRTAPTATRPRVLPCHKTRSIGGIERTENADRQARQIHGAELLKPEAAKVTLTTAGAIATHHAEASRASCTPKIRSPSQQPSSPLHEDGSTCTRETKIRSPQAPLKRQEPFARHRPA